MSFLLGRSERRASLFPYPPIPPNSQQGGGFAQVDLSRTETSLQKVAVYACVALVAAIAETMPLDHYPRPRETAPMPSWLEDLGGDGYGLPDWTSQFVYSSMLRGNAVGAVGARDRSRGTPTLIQLQHPDLVSVWLDENGRPDWRFNGQKAEDVWHTRVQPVPQRLMGLSPIAVHALTIGTGISAMRFGAQWFQEGSHPSAILSTDQNLNPDQALTAKQRFMAAVYGRREPAVLGNGWKYQSIQIPPNESQFLETNNYTGAECCRIFGPGFAEILGYETGGSLTYSNIEQRSLDLLTYAVNPWLVRIERALSALLPKQQTVKYNRAALVRTDLLTRFRAHGIAIQNGFETVNEVRDLEDRTPVAWGNEPPAERPGPTTISLGG
ncbi:phage portal protein [Streptomyces jumonjinensis]|uniref:Phage portal protein n=1 Tax=Streptomyces jumonjinensis TaxID=1945 RepID=A0A646KM63_STRJU|nr:phage portal protein [Streptomyces jumonjinensis]MQT03170.1 phage portal protein [Streptomyces jumonjinensis]